MPKDLTYGHINGHIFEKVRAGTYCPYCKSTDVSKIMDKVRLSSYTKQYKIIDFSVYDCNFCKAEFGIKNEFE